MTTKLKHVLCNVATAGALLALSACSHQEAAQQAASFDHPGPVENTTLEAAHFAYDSNALTSDAKAELDKAASFMKAHPRTFFQIEGNTDERGTSQYNLALGERRAAAARDYLVQQGVDTTHLGIISYGAERPIDTAHNEAAWAQNRRAVPMVVDEAKLAR